MIHASQSSAFDPGNLSGLVLRFESGNLYSTNKVNGSRVWSWPETISGYNATNSGATAPYATNGSFGGNWSVCFLGNATTANPLFLPTAAYTLSENLSGWTTVVVGIDSTGTSSAYNFAFFTAVNGSQNNARISVANYSVSPIGWVTRTRRADADAGINAVCPMSNGSLVSQAVVGAIDFSGGSESIWTNGTSYATSTLASSGNSASTAAGAMVIGGDGISQQGFTGWIAAVLCWNRKLNTTEIGQVTTWARAKYSF
jgi:hypothetical protein